MASPFQYLNEEDAVREQANQWLARFAPLVMDDAAPYELELIHKRIKTVSELRERAPVLAEKLSHLTQPEDLELSDTLRQATSQLGSIDTDLRKQLSRVAPGDPLGKVDIGDLQERLAERQAQQEVGVTQSDLVPAVLELETSPSNWAAAVGMGGFGLAWTAFTTFHCIMMVGGMVRAFGWVGLALLAFYSLFFFVGFGMLYGALNSICTESIRLEGRTLHIKRKLRNWIRTKTYHLAPDTKASVGSPQGDGAVLEKNSVPVMAINLTDDRGKGISFGPATTREHKEKMAHQINEYLSIYG